MATRSRCSTTVLTQLLAVLCEKKKCSVFASCCSCWYHHHVIVLLYDIQCVPYVMKRGMAGRFEKMPHPWTDRFSYYGTPWNDRFSYDGTPGLIDFHETEPPGTIDFQSSRSPRVLLYEEFRCRKRRHWIQLSISYRAFSNLFDMMMPFNVTTAAAASALEPFISSIDRSIENERERERGRKPSETF